MMYKVSEINKVHLEISSNCNASCSLCPRTLWGYPYNNGYTEHNMSIGEAQAIFKPEFIKQLDELLINGNFGDFVMAPDSVDIVKYFFKHNANLKIFVSTNGGAQNTAWWSRLGKISPNLLVHFSIDGLEDTNHIYRQNVNWDRVMENAQAYISAGGQATWKFVKFKHNEHQIEQAKQLSRKLGFKSFTTVWDGRDTGPVFNRHGELVTYLNADNPMPYLGPEVPFSQILEGTQSRDCSQVNYSDHTVKKITCDAVRRKEIYVSSIGDVYPCCFLGFEPKTYGKGTYMEGANNQFKHFVTENNALEYDLEHCIKWFDKVEATWDIERFEDGRLVTCNNSCGEREKVWNESVKKTNE